MIPVEDIPIEDLPVEYRSTCKGYVPWSSDRIFVNPDLDEKQRFLTIEHEREHIRQARRYPSTLHWKSAYERAEMRGYVHNVFEIQANLAAFAAWKNRHRRAQ